MTDGNLWFRNQMAPYLNGLAPYLNIVVTAVNAAAFPVTGEDTKLYVDEATTQTYRWNGSAYVEISSTQAVSDATTILKGIVELATTAETNAGTDSTRAVTPASLTNVLSDISTNSAKVTNVTTDLGYTPSPTDGTVTSSDGNDATLPLATGTNAGLLTPAHFTELSNIGNANGIAELDGSGLVPAAQLPAYVDDVIMAANLVAIQAITPLESGKIYVALDTNLTYRWSGAGTAMVEISSSLALGITSATAYRGDRGKIAYDHSQVAHAPSNADNTAANETSHTDVLVDGEFASAGLMKTDGAGNYSIDASVYATETFVANGLEDPLVDITDLEALADINTALGI